MDMISGVCVALVTLFDTDGNVDMGATVDHARRLEDIGIAGFLVAGTTGEAAALERSERADLVGATRRAVSGWVVAGTGGPSARQAVLLTRDAVDAGADAVLALSPPFNDDARDYYREVANVADPVPVLAYHLPAVSAPGLTIDQLCELPVAGVKDSSGDLSRLIATLDRFDGACYTGSQAALTTAATLGARGAMLGIANAEPELALRAWSGDVAAQLELQGIAATVKRGLVGGLKQHMATKFETSPVVRMA